MPLFSTSRRKSVRQPAVPIVEDSSASQEPPGWEKILRDILAEFPPPKDDDEEEPVVERSPVVRLVNAIICLAIDRQATDIIWEPIRRATRIRCGALGFLVEILAYPPHLHSPVIERFQSMAALSELDLTRPQVGIIRLRHNNQDFDFRTTWIPTQYGGKIHVRIHSRNLPSLSEQGVPPIFISDLTESLQKREGMILFVGPPASGKTILASQFLWRLDPYEYSVHTLEWPVEVSLFGGTQTPRHPIHGPGPMDTVKAAIKAGAHTFFLSVIEDEETATAAFYAVEAGLGVVATMDLAHPERVGSVLERFRISSERQQKFVKTIVAPKRLPALCSQCRVPIPVTPELQKEIGFLYRKDSVPEHIYTRNVEGCEACYEQGVLGSRQLLELWNIDGTSRQVLRYATMEEILAGNLSIEESKDDD